MPLHFDVNENLLVCHKNGKIYFKGELINQLILSCFQVYMHYDFEKWNIRTDSCDKSAWFGLYNLFLFVNELELEQIEPTMLVSDRRLVKNG